MPMIHSEHTCQRFWPGIGKPSNLRLCSMTGCTTIHCIVLGSGRYNDDEEAGEAAESSAVVAEELPSPVGTHPTATSPERGTEGSPSMAAWTLPPCGQEQAAPGRDPAAPEPYPGNFSRSRLCHPRVTGRPPEADTSLLMQISRRRTVPGAVATLKP